MSRSRLRRGFGAEREKITLSPLLFPSLPPLLASVGGGIVIEIGTIDGADIANEGTVSGIGAGSGSCGGISCEVAAKAMGSTGAITTDTAAATGVTVGGAVSSSDDDDKARVLCVLSLGTFFNDFVAGVGAAVGVPVAVPNVVAVLLADFIVVAAGSVVIAD